MAKDMQCPDGLHFDPAAPWPNYPCGYPMEVSCQGRGAARKDKSICFSNELTILWTNNTAVGISVDLMMSKPSYFFTWQERFVML